MNRKLTQLATTAVVALAAFGAAPPASAALQVSVRPIDTVTGGDYRLGPYGSCFSVVAQASPVRQYPEVTVGPEFYTLAPDLYDNRCSAAMTTTNRWENTSGCLGQPGLVGELIPNREFDSAVCVTSQGLVVTDPITLTDFDFRFYRRDVSKPNQQGNAFAWSYLPNNGGALEGGEVFPDTVLPDGSTRHVGQFNACRSESAGVDVYRPSTFDNDLYSFDPLSGVLDLTSGGDATIAYYFLTAGLACRQMYWDLYIDIDDGNGELLKASGAIGDFPSGKYLVFDLTGIPETGALVRLATRNNGQLNTCASQPGSTKAVNSIISGVFVDGTYACNPPDLICRNGTTINKTTNGTDGATILVGEPVTWEYQVKNENAVTMESIAVTDDQGVAVTCPYDSLGPGESMTCTASGTAVVGPYSNTGTLSATTAYGDLSCSDASSYTGIPLACVSGTSINKLTNNADGPTLDPGAAVQWSYHVVNPNSVEVAYSVTDDKEGAICSGTLAAGDETTCLKSGVAGATSYSNVGTVTFSTPTAPPVSCSDDSSYVVPPPPPPLACENGTSINKLTNGTDGPTLDPGAFIEWSYQVVNPNSVEVAYSVVDDKEGPVCSGTLGAGGTTTCLMNGIAGMTSYANVGTVTFSAPDTEPVSCSDGSSYVPAPPPPDLICLNGTSINKTTNGSDGPSLPSDTPVTWTYEVHNQNEVPVTFSVTDDQEGAICDGTLGPFGTTTCSKGGISGSADYENTGTLTLSANGKTAVCSDTSSYKYEPPPPSNPGTGTPGYWKNHPDAWPVSSIVIGGRLYTKAEAITWMKAATKRDKTTNMFEQLVSAKLNVLIGNNDSCIADTIAAADAWMAAHPVGSGVTADSAAWQTETNPSASVLHSTLDAYNNGLLCAPHRD